MERVLVSACLLGARVRYHGGDARAQHDALDRWLAEGRVVALCPEVAGGLSTPRPPAEIVERGSRLRVLTNESRDVTGAFERGAAIAAHAVQEHGIRIAVLKDGSPSCGSSRIYDGTFSGRAVAGDGVTAARLRSLGVRIFNEMELDQAAAYLAHLEEPPTLRDNREISCSPLSP
ncbi:MAG: DUF523 domain-containing protein [Acidobacteria bacterium]|nr:MAG: DUF523 domain-containing protein [Acidobacteriota bacterium]